MEQVRHACRLRHLSRRTEEAYCYWIRRFIVALDKRHPSTMGAAEIATFLSSLATNDHVSASTQNQALCAVLFLYRAVIDRPIGDLGPIVRVRTPPRLPVVLDRSEVRAILNELSGVPWLVVSLLYGAGLRLLECLELRIKDIDGASLQVVVRQGKGRRDRLTMLPASLAPALTTHIETVRAIHNRDLARGFGRAVLPHALNEKYPNAGRSWPWQFVFPSARICVDPRWALLRDASAGGRLRHSDRSRAAGPRGRQHDDDLHTRSQSWRAGCTKPGRPTVTYRSSASDGGVVADAQPITEHFRHTGGKTKRLLKR